MILETNELTQLYEAVIKPFGHPDPSGFMTRALLLSEGDPDYVGLDGKRGFMPVDAGLALEMTGATEIQSLQANLVATLTMDRMFFELTGDIDDMIIVFHYGVETLETGTPSGAISFLKEVNDARGDMINLMYPPMATMDDVIKAMSPSEIDPRLSTSEKDFFEFLLKV